MTLLRDFHGRMEAEVFSHHGTLEKFIGDALLATFGVPNQGKQDATDALSCAYAMLARLETWNAERTRQGETPIQIGIGLHFGPAVLGDIGSQRNMAFAVIGDTVNTTSRLQTLTRDLGTPMVISDTLVQTVRQEVGDQADRLLHGLRTAGPQTLRGREERVAVWVLASPVE
jgi:adenylate cyclase